MSRVYAAVLVLLFAIPFVAHAQTVAELEAQIDALLKQMAALQKQSNPTSATPSSAGSCPALSRTLQKGIRGDDVVALQLFLKAEGVFNEEATGYFGAITERAVQEWQARAGIASSGSPSLNGWGVVGPKTRATIAGRCAAQPSPAASATAAPAPNPTPACPSVATTTPAAQCGVAWELVRDSYCNVSWKCAVPPQRGSNRPPVVHDIVGPSSLGAGTLGRWVVKASDPDNDTLEYEISWGETRTALDILERIAGITAPVSFDGSFTHTYTTGGSYIITAKVRDPSGKESTGTATVVVKSATEPVCVGCVATSSPFTADIPQTNTVFVPDGVTHCVTPWGGKLVTSGTAMTPGMHFEGSVPATVAMMKCVTGKWYRCDAQGANCIAHVPPVTNATMVGLQTYMGVVGSQCSTNQSTLTVRTAPGSLLCKSDQQGGPGACAMAQEETAIGLYCAHTNWAESLTF